MLWVYRRRPSQKNWYKLCSIYSATLKVKNRSCAWTVPYGFPSGLTEGTEAWLVITIYSISYNNVSYFSHIKESNIVTYIAAAVENTNLYQVLQPLQGSLRSYLPHWDDDFDTNKIGKVVDIMKSVVAGLRFLHDKHLVHFDLSMDTVAVSSLMGNTGNGAFCIALVLSQ